MTDQSGVASTRAPIVSSAAPVPTTDPAEEMKAYRELVEACAKRADGAVLFNQSPAHAVVVIENIFRASNATVDILTGELHEPIYGAREVVAAAVDFLSRPGAKMRIVSEKSLGGTHPLLASAAEKGLSDRITLGQISPNARQYHFMLGDAKHFRFEPNKNKHDFSAVCQFGEPKIGDNLKRAFDNLCNLPTA